MCIRDRIGTGCGVPGVMASRTIENDRDQMCIRDRCTMGDDGFYYRNGEKLGFVISVGAGDQVRDVYKRQGQVSVFFQDLRKYS